MRTSALLLGLLLAGCVTPPEGSDPTAATPALDAARTIPWSLQECDYVVGWSDADPAALQARLPEGFQVAGGSFFGLVGSPRATLGTEAFTCARGHGAEGVLEPMTYGSIWFGVIPSEEYTFDGVEQYYWKENILVPDDPRRALFEALGAPVHEGDAVQGASRGPAGRGATLTLEGFGDFGLSLDVPQAASTPEGAEFVELTPTEDGGIIVWHANYSWAEDQPFMQGRGTVTWPEGSWAAEAVGASTAPAAFHSGRWGFNGTITFPR